MVSGELVQSYLARVQEARLYHEQGLGDGAVEIFEEILSELGEARLSEPDKENISSLVRKELERVKTPGDNQGGLGQGLNEQQAPPSVDPSESYEYAIALMDGQFWEDAIRELKKAAVVGNQMQECWELCGDCAARLERWDEAISYYEIVYTQPDVSESVKQQVLAKITKCTQTLRKKGARAPIPPKAEAKAEESPSDHGAVAMENRSEFMNLSMTSLDESPANRLIGERITSWQSAKGETLRNQQCVYRISNVLHVGMSSLVVELEEEETGRIHAGQLLNAPFSQMASADVLARWAHTMTLIDSRHLVNIHDVAHLGEQFCFVREYMPLTLGDLLSKEEAMPVPLATYLAYQILIGLGDLHLHMGQDERIRRLFHLDLRPSRILLSAERPRLKINNGGLWKVMEENNPRGVAIHKLPLPFLAYRAPEQFRPYLSRRKPPIFSDIYLMGSIFYEMLTGVPAFKAASFEEYEIQHCEQYPNPPKVWRRDIPEQLNEIVMKCLELDPFKRWRSTTELALILEKTFTGSCNPAKDDSYSQFLKTCKLG